LTNKYLYLGNDRRQAHSSMEDLHEIAYGNFDRYKFYDLEWPWTTVAHLFILYFFPELPV